MAAACRCYHRNDQDFADERLITILHELFLCNLQDNFRREKVSIHVRYVSYERLISEMCTPVNLEIN